MSTRVTYVVPDDFTGPAYVVFGSKQPRFWQRNIIYTLDTTGVLFSEYNGIYGGVLWSQHLTVRQEDGTILPYYPSPIRKTDNMVSPPGGKVVGLISNNSCGIGNSFAPGSINVNIGGVVIRPAADVYEHHRPCDTLLRYLETEPWQRHITLHQLKVPAG